MAKKDEDKKEKKKSKGSPITDIFDAVDKLNPDASFLNNSALSYVDDYIDTGSLALNAIISGDMFKGTPRGRILGLAGPSSSGKSLFVKQILGNAQKKGYTAVIWDTENAIDGAGSEALGLDPKKTKYYPVETIEACKNQVSTFLQRIIETNAELREEGKPELKVIIAIDSLANLASAKELADIEKGSESMDMGTRAKALKSMMRVLTFQAAKAKVPIIVTNHIYDNPGELRPSMIKTQSGGKGLVYLASILVQLSMTAEKGSDDDSGGEEDDNAPMIAIANNRNGVNLTALTTKNRFVPPYLKTRLYLNFKTGLSKYAGLFEIGQAFNVIVRDGKRWVLVKEQGLVPDDKLGYDNHIKAGKAEMLGFKKDWISNLSVWEKIVGPLNEVIKKELTYGNASAIVSKEAAEQGALLENVDEEEAETEST
jgi:RecA/RadA recombinase